MASSGLVVAREGYHTELSDGSRYLVFKDGRRYEGTPGQLDYRIVQFERYWMRLDPVAIVSAGNRHPPGTVHTNCWPMPRRRRAPSCCGAWVCRFPRWFSRSWRFRSVSSTRGRAVPTGW